MAILESTLNISIAAALSGMRKHWKVSGEETRVFADSNKRPDIVIRRLGRPPVLIENEFMPARGVEKEARERLGLKMNFEGKVKAVVALRSPAHLKKSASGDKLAALVRSEKEYQYALLTDDEKSKRFPKNGWLTGTIADLADFAYNASVTADAVRDAVTLLRTAVDSASKDMDGAAAFRTDIQKKLGELLRQEYGDGDQTRRMVMLILINAFVFHYHLEGYEGIRNISEIEEECPSGVITSDALLEEWGNILKVNYWPIFHIARQILQIVPPSVSRVFLPQLRRTAASLITDGVTTSHDLSGSVFQQLIADRTFLATFYTRPPSATLLSNLAIPDERPFDGGTWAKNAQDYTIADFACGTGTLLSSAYRRVSELLEHEGGDMKKAHTAMIEKAVIGCDVMPAAVHLTASILSGMHPEIKFKNTRLYTLPYGKGADNDYATGSLELLREQSVFSILDTGAVQQAGTGEKSVQTQQIGWRSSDLVIMNPPFTSDTVHEGVNTKVPNPVWAGFGMSKDAQKKIAARAKSLRQGTCAHGNAGIASDFIALADKMVKMDGTTAFVLPLSVLAGESWKKVRTLWADNYRDICVATIAEQNIDNCSFSADTGMAETLFIGKKTNNGNGNGNGREHRPVPHRGNFIVLNRRPDNEIEAGEYARAIRRTMRGNLRKLEDGPVGGTKITAGTSTIGEILNAPLPKVAEDAWGISRIRDMSLAQVAHGLTQGRLSMPGRKGSHALTVCELRKFAQRGFISRDINGVTNGKPRGPFDIATLPGSSQVPTYPCLWNHDAKRENRLIVAPDCEGIIRSGMEDRADEVWQTASRVHLNAFFQFNSQALAVAFTERPSLGGVPWPNIILKTDAHEMAYSLWGNSTLALLLYWWQASKQQSGRGIISPSRFPGMMFADMNKLSAKQLATAKKKFDAIKARPFLPIHLAHEDKSRAMLDKIVLVDVLGLPKSVLDGVALVREKLAREPSVRGGKD